MRMGTRASTGTAWRISALIAVLGVYYGIQILTVVLAIYTHLELAGLTDDVRLWVQPIDHHLWQLVLALVLIALLSRGRWAEWGLTLRNRRASLHGLRHGFFPVLLISLMVGEFLFPIITGREPAVAYPLRALDFLGILIFMALVSGLSEEILFRGLMQTWLANFWTGSIHLAGIRVSTAGLLMAIVFALVHITFRLDPLRIAHFYAPQIALAFVLGVYYAVMYDRTGSLLAPIVAHNAVNGGIFLSRYFAAAVVG
jgi:uncharacterized protein